MATISYWLIPCTNDSQVYSIMAQTKKEAIEQLNSFCNDIGGFVEYNDHYIYLYRIQMWFKNTYQMVEFMTSEAGGRDQSLCNAVSKYRAKYCEDANQLKFKKVKID